MPKDDKELIKDLTGKIPMPQYKDAVSGDLKLTRGNHAPFTQMLDNEGNIVGKNNPMAVQLSGSSAQLETKATPIKDMIVASITIGSTATELKAGASALANRKQIMLEAPTAGIIYWGKSGVTSATGLALAAGSAPLILDVDASSPKLYAVSDGTNRTVKVGEFA